MIYQIEFYLFYLNLNIRYYFSHNLSICIIFRNVLMFCFIYVTFSHSPLFSVIKGFLVRKKTRPRIEKRRKATLLIQSQFRGHLARKTLQERKSVKMRQEKSAIIIQKGM